MSTSSQRSLSQEKPRKGMQGFFVYTTILALCLGALAATYMLFVEAPPPRKIVIATGGEAGAYFKFGKQYAVELEKAGLTVDVKPTNGSVDNLKLLEDDDSGVAVAIIQSGVSKKEDREKLLALGSLYREPLFVFYRSEKKLFEDKPPPKKVIIASGGKTGAYFKFANEYAAELQKDGITLEVRATAGSVENLKLLDDDKSGVSVALVQSGVARPVDREKLVALGSLYREPLWVFYAGGGGTSLKSLSQLEGSQIYVGKKESGTYPIAIELLKANGVVDAEGRPTGTTKLIEEAGDIKKLKSAVPDTRNVAFVVAAVETPAVKALLKDPDIHLMNFGEHAAYHRRFRFLSQVTMPAGLINLGANNIPPVDVDLVAPTAMLVVHKDIHPTISKLLLNAAVKVHARGDLLSNPGEFPSASYTDIPISEDAKQFYRGGLPQLAPPIDRLSFFEGKRIGIGVPGSGTYAIAQQLLAANDMKGKITTVEENTAKTVDKLKRGGADGLDVAFFVAAIEAGYIKDLMADPNIRLLSFTQHEAYHRKFRYLSEVTIPAGLVNLGYNVPRHDINLISPTAMLVVRKDVHPAIIALLLDTAAKVHGKGDEFTSPGEFPSPAFTDIPVSEDARHFFKSGPPFLQRYLPFWLASLADRLKIMLIPLVMLLMPLVRAAPPLVQWRTRRKIYRWYSDLRDVDKKIALGLASPQLEIEIARMSDIEQQVAFVEVPLSYMNEFYHLRLHLAMMQEKLDKLRTAAKDRADRQ